MVFALDIQSVLNANSKRKNILYSNDVVSFVSLFFSADRLLHFRLFVLLNQNRKHIHTREITRRHSAHVRVDEMSVGVRITLDTDANVCMI